MNQSDNSLLPSEKKAEVNPAWLKLSLPGTMRSNPEKRRQAYFRDRDRRSAIAKKNYIKNRARILERVKTYRENNLATIKQKKSEYSKTKRVKEIARVKRQNLSLKIKEKNAARIKHWKNSHKQQLSERHKFRYKNDLNYRLRINLRNQLRTQMKVQNAFKSKSALNLVGCSLTFLREYLSSKFQPGMSFDNYGQWHIDHIIPCASFDLNDWDAQRQCFHYSNLQPLWATDNFKKNKTNPPTHQAQLL
jgi:hypothetical protein